MRQNKKIDLAGVWDFITDPEQQYEKKGVFYGELSLDWQSIQVPSHWQKTGYEGYQGTVWYRKQFSLSGLSRPDTQVDLTKGRIILTFAAVDYFAEVWLNGVYLGFHEGDFDSFYFDITDKVNVNEPNMLYVKVTAEIDRRPEHKEIVKGGIYHWDCLPIKQEGLRDCPEVPSAANPQYPNPLINPGGIWQDVFVSLAEHGNIESLKVTPVLTKDYQSAETFIELTYHHYRLPEHGEIIIEAMPDNFSGDTVTTRVPLAAKTGKNAYMHTLSIDHPALWWSWDLGHPSLYRLRITISMENTVVDQKAICFGIREIVRDSNWGLYLNGKRFFARGTNYLSDQFLSMVSEEIYHQDLELIRSAHMNMIRVFAHVEREEFYDICDRLGIMIYQDLPFQWGYQDEGLFIQRAQETTRKTVEQLYNHSSVIMWSCHSESRLHDYNKLDNVLVDTVQDLDSTRLVHKNSVLAASDKLPYFFKDLEEFGEYSPRHLSVFWVGWYWGEVADTEAYNPLFVTEFGTQSIPNEESLRKFFDTKDLWPANWEEWRRRGFQTNIYQKNLGDFPDTLQELIEKTQAYQAHFYKIQIEAWRRKKYHQVNGLLQFHLVNPWPAIDWSVVDYYRQPKKAYYVIQKAFHPLLVSAKAESVSVVERKGGQRSWQYRLSVWIVNDYHRAYEDTRLCLKVEDEIGGRLWKKTVALERVEADVSAKVYFCEIESSTRQIIAKTKWVTETGEILADNINILVPPKDLSKIEDPVKAKVGL